MATAGKTVGFKDKDYVDNEFIDIKSAPDEEYLKGDGTWATAAEIVGGGLLLDTLGDVTLTSLADNDFLIYDTATSLWENKASSTVRDSIGLGSSDSVDFDNLTLTGNLVVGGTRTIINTEVLGVVDPIITLQTATDGGPLTVDSNKDVGLGLQYFDGSAKTAFLGFDDSELKLTFVPDATITNEVVTGTKGTIVADLEGTITAQGDTELYALSQVTSAADKGIQFTGSGTAATYDLTIAGKALLDDVDVATQRLTLGLGSVATHSLSSVIAMTASQVPGYLQHLDPASISILKSGLGTIATHSLSSVLGLLGEPRLPNYITPTTRNILKSGLGTIATHSLSSVIAMTASQVPGYLQHLSPASISILKSGLGTIATHSLSSVVAMMSSTTSIGGMKDIDVTGVSTNDIIVYDGTRWVNQTAPTARLSLGLGSIATHSLSSVLAIASGSASATYSPATKRILKSGLGTIATHSLSSVLAMTQASGAAAKVAAAALAYLLLEAGGGLGGQKLENEADTDDTNFIVLPNAADDFSTYPLTSQDIGVEIQAYDATIVVDADIGSTVQAYDSTIVVDADIGVSVQAYDATTPVGSSILVDADIGSTVQAYDATIVVDADIGVSVQAYDATILVDADIGSTVQAFGSYQTTDPELTAIAGLNSSSNKGIYFTGYQTASTFDLTSAGRTLVGAADYHAQRNALTLGTGYTPEFLSVKCTGTGSMTVPTGTTAQQGTPAQGGMRYNTTTPGFEGYDGSAWGALGGAVGGATSHIISEVDTGTVDLDGTYTETIMIADVFNVAGAVVLTADFYMSKISDDGTNVTITGSGSITGSGTIGQVFPFMTGTSAEIRSRIGVGTVATHSLSSVLAMAKGTSPTKREVIQLIGENVTPATDFVSKASGGTFSGAVSVQANLNTYNVLPATNTTYDIGASGNKYNNVYATTFQGTATSANWSDLAERYEADKYYDKGTVLAIGGEKEVTEYVKGSGGHKKEMRMPFAGVVSIHPGLRMNDKEEYWGNPNFPYICLKGRIPVKINGTAKKGDYIVADDAGRGKSIGKQPNVSVIHDLIGIALEDSNSGFVEVKV